MRSRYDSMVWYNWFLDRPTGVFCLTLVSVGSFISMTTAMCKPAPCVFQSKSPTRSLGLDKLLVFTGSHFLRMLRQFLPLYIITLCTQEQGLVCQEPAMGGCRSKYHITHSMCFYKGCGKVFSLLIEINSYFLD